MASELSFATLSQLSLVANKYKLLLNQTFMLISQNKKNSQPEISLIEFQIQNFPHLIAMSPQNCSYQEFFDKCLNRTLMQKDFSLAKSHTLKDIDEKAKVLNDLLDFKHLKIMHYGNSKSKINKLIQSINNQFNFAVGTKNKGVIGYSQKDYKNWAFPKTTLAGDLDKLIPDNMPVIAVLSKNKKAQKYNEIFSELYKGKYAEVSHSLNPNILNLISIPNMEEQYKLNITRLIDASLKDIFNPNICDKSIRDKAHALQPALKESILINADEIAKWLNEEISTRQGKTLIISSDLDEIIYTRTILNILNESSRTVNFELAKDTNKIGFTVKNAMPSLEKKDLIQHLAEGCVAIDENFLNTQANLSAENYDKYFADNYMYVSNAEVPFLIVREEDLKRVPIHIPSLDDIIAEKLNSQDLSQDDTQKIFSYKYEDPSLD